MPSICRPRIYVQLICSKSSLGISRATPLTDLSGLAGAMFLVFSAAFSLASTGHPNHHRFRRWLIFVEHQVSMASRPWGRLEGSYCRRSRRVRSNKQPSARSQCCTPVHLVCSFISWRQIRVYSGLRFVRTSRAVRDASCRLPSLSGSIDVCLLCCQPGLLSHCSAMIEPSGRSSEHKKHVRQHLLTSSPLPC